MSSVALTMAPGPDILYVFSQSLTQGSKHGFIITLGLLTGLVFHTSATVLGLGFIITMYPNIFYSIKVLGAMYLVFIAIKLLIKSSQIKISSKTENSFRQNYLNGFVMNVVNPKVSLFFISFFPGFLFHEKWSVSFQFFCLGVVFILQSFIIFCLVSVFSDRMSKILLLTKNNKFWTFFQVLILILIAVFLISNYE